MENEKKPIYLWVLSILSLILSVLGVYGTWAPKNEFSMDYSALPKEQANQVQMQLDFAKLSQDFTHNTVNRALALLGLILIVAVIVFLVRKNVLYANVTYFAYVLLAIIGLVYTNIGLRPAITSSYTTDLLRASAQMGANLVSGVTIFINVIFLAIVGYKLWNQNKVAEEE